MAVLVHGCSMHQLFSQWAPNNYLVNYIQLNIEPVETDFYLAN